MYEYVYITFFVIFLKFFYLFYAIQSISRNVWDVFLILALCLALSLPPSISDYQSTAYIVLKIFNRCTIQHS